MNFDELHIEYMKMCNNLKECDVCKYNGNFPCQVLFGYDKGRTDAIDEFVKAFKDNMLKSTTPTWTCYVEEIAEQLKEQK